MDTDIRIEKYKNVTDLRQYDRAYKVINDGTNGDEVVEKVWEMCIPGKYGTIYPVGFNGDLAVMVTSPRVVARVASVLADHIKPGLGTQGPVGVATEIAVRFPHETSLLHRVAKLIGAKRSRKGKGRTFTPEQKAANTARLKAWRESRQKPAGSPDSLAAA